MSPQNVKYIGLRDGNGDGMFSWSLTLKEITPDVVQTDPGYKPMWVAEVDTADWTSWQGFLTSNDYAGRSYHAWDDFWDRFTEAPILDGKAWEDWKTVHLKR